MRTDHRIRVCNFVYLFWAHSCLLRAPVPCAFVCGRATHGLPLCGHWCTVGVHAGTHQCALRCPDRMASGTKRQLCAVLVLRRRGTRIRQSGTVELVTCALTAMKWSAPPLE